MVTKLAGADQVDTSHLVMRRADPLNCETQLSQLVGTVVPNANFYIRNHFPAPELDAASWQLSINGLVNTALHLRLADILRFPVQTLMVTLECAGNGRTFFRPAIDGDPVSYTHLTLPTICSV